MNFKQVLKFVSALKHFIISLLFFSLFSFHLSSQNVTLKGVAKGAEGETLDVYAYSDLLSYKLKKIASGKIDTSGSFNFSFKINETIYTYVKVGFTRAPLYIEPGKTYTMKISCDACKSPDDKTNPYLEPKELILTIENTDSTELNNLVYHFNDDYDWFMYKNYVKLLKQRSKSTVDSFRTRVNEKYGKINNDYFKALVRYRLASIEELAQLSDDKSMAEKYFFAQPVLYNNTGYMEFFNDFFGNYITMKSPEIKSDDLEKTVNELKSFPALMDSLGKDTLLKNEVIREFVALKFLAEVYYKKDYDQAAVLGMIKYVSENSKFYVHQNAAKNYVEFFTKLSKGTSAPDFTLKDINTQYYSLKELNKEKYVYLIFWTSWCIPCITEMELIGKLIEKYGTKVEFVGISCDKSFMTFYNFMKENDKINFTNLHWGGNSELIENYDVRAYPKYVMIDPDGKIFLNPAMSPSENLNEYLLDLTKKGK